MIKTDFLVIGSGIAGLRASLELAHKGHKVLLVTKKKLCDANTTYAQGGIAAVTHTNGDTHYDDSFSSHISDTLAAGAGVCREDTVNLFVNDAYCEVIKPLITWGVPFTKKVTTGDYSLHQEGGHATARIYHVADFTGRAIEETLAREVQSNPKITIMENAVAIDLVIDHESKVCNGAYLFNSVTGEIYGVAAANTFLATGGAGRVYMYTSNPDTATGDGIAMAYRSGLPIVNMEFIQFHPTTFYDPGTASESGRRFLITEALRGKIVGGRLTLSKKSTVDFVREEGYHPDGSSATRDVVARAIDTEMKKRGLDHVYLNLTTEVTGLTAQDLEEGFPDIYGHCKDRGLLMERDPIPVVPGTHYTCGGIDVGSHGETALSHLYAIGECACTGLHGGNRLASNSLSEAALYGKRAVTHAMEHTREIPLIPAWDFGDAVESVDQIQVSHQWDEVRRLMWNLVGISRSETRLRMASKRIKLIAEEVNEYYWNYFITPDLIELRNIVDCAAIIIKAAMNRQESRGAHYRIDAPQPIKRFEKEITIQRYYNE